MQALKTPTQSEITHQVYFKEPPAFVENARMSVATSLTREAPPVQFLFDDELSQAEVLP